MPNAWRPALRTEVQYDSYCAQVSSIYGNLIGLVDLVTKNNRLLELKRCLELELVVGTAQKFSWICQKFSWIWTCWRRTSPLACTKGRARQPADRKSKKAPQLSIPSRIPCRVRSDALLSSLSSTRRAEEQESARRKSARSRQALLSHATYQETMPSFSNSSSSMPTWSPPVR